MAGIQTKLAMVASMQYEVQTDHHHHHTMTTGPRFIRTACTTLPCLLTYAKVVALVKAPDTQVMAVTHCAMIPFDLTVITEPPVRGGTTSIRVVTLVSPLNPVQGMTEGALHVTWTPPLHYVPPTRLQSCQVQTGMPIDLHQNWLTQTDTHLMAGLKQSREVQPKPGH